MRNVSDAFKTAVTSYGRQTRVVIDIGEKSFTGSSVVSVRHAFDGGLLRSVMRECEIEFDGVDSLGGSDVKGTEIDSVSVGVKASGETEFNMLDLGRFVVNEIEQDKAKNSVILKCYDEMIYSMVPYDLSLTYPMTLGDYLAAICTRFGWTLGTTSFVNSDVEIEEEKYDSDYTFRDVLDQIAQVAAGTIAFLNGSLCVLYPTESGAIYTADNMVSSDGITIGELYGPVTSVVLARTPQEDNIYRIADGVAFEEAVEFKIENNQIMDSHREDFIDAIFEQLNGLSFYLYDFHSFGYLYVDLMDFFTLQDQNGNQYKCLMLLEEFTVGQGIDETSICERPAESVTDYAAASKTDRVINQTILRVDKQEREITSLVRNVKVAQDGITALQGGLTEIRQTASDLSVVVQKIESDGAEKVTTRTNRYTFDDEGLNVSREGEPISNLIDHTGMYVTENGDVVLSANNEGVKAVDITVNNYLVVGEHSRFEDFISDEGEERTGCFWLK